MNVFQYNKPGFADPDPGVLVGYGCFKEVGSGSGFQNMVGSGFENLEGSGSGLNIQGLKLL